MKVVAIVQKPLDVLNTLEYLHAIEAGETSVSWLVVGESGRQQAAMSFLRASGADAHYVFGPDLLMHDVLFSRTSAQRPFVRRALLAALTPLAIAHWHAAIFVQLAQLRAFRTADLVIYDAWRSKVLSLLGLSGIRQCIIDGGYSTLSYGLLEAFQRGGARALVDASLVRQRKFFPVPWLHKAILQQVDEGAVFFSAYWNGGALPTNALRNRYEYFLSKLAANRASGVYLVLGYAAFNLALESCRFALEWVAQSQPDRRHSCTVVYRPHPVDAARKTRAELENVRRDLSRELGLDVTLDIPEYGLECDLLQADRVPEVIFGYQSSAKVVIERSSHVRWVDLPFEFHPEERAAG